MGFAPSETSTSTVAYGGRLVMLEPWISVAGRVLWTYSHHDGCDLSVVPSTPWGAPRKDPMWGNAALSYLYFASGEYLDEMGSSLRVVDRAPFPGVAWILSGGFQSFSLLPRSGHGLAGRIDRLLARTPTWTATRCLLTLERMQ